VDKPGTEIDLQAKIQVKQRSPYVSRGGEKLAKAIAHFAIPVVDRICLDGGISTGGFTDCLLQAGAQHVYGVDVGYGQVAWNLRQDPRVTLRERTNLRHLAPTDLYGSDRLADLGVVDVSFISLTKVVSALWQLLRSPREVVLLVKPQFEVGRALVGKNGVVRDPQDQAMAIFQVLEAAQALGWHYYGVTWSPLLGPAGNIEYLLWLKDVERSAGQSESLGGLAQESAIDSPALQEPIVAPDLIAPDLNVLKQLTLTAQQTLTR
jgi:23S rRNA (cytidine1920-2'-O)/16S rRNA (cytidine1409-2'-O)-methyltransferase